MRRGAAHLQAASDLIGKVGITQPEIHSAQLAEVPLDVRPFATDAASQGKPAVVRGCIVVDTKIGMLVNAPRHQGAASYRFSRTDARGVVTQLGVVAAAKVRELAGDLR